MKLSVDHSYMTFVAIQAALRGGNILRKGFGTNFSISSKPGRQNIVTEYDHASEACIISYIKKIFPDHDFLAEESGLTNISAGNQIRWIIDPLDGTTNFARNIPFFTISIAAYLGEEGICGVIYQPLTNELFVTEKGKGAFLNGEKLAVSKTANLDESLIGAGYPYNIGEENIPYLNHLIQLTKDGAVFRHLGSAALCLAYVAAGKLDGFWIDYLYPWDFAAGKLLIEEAGGKITRYNGTKLLIQQSSDILATNNILHEKMLYAQ